LAQTGLERIQRRLGGLRLRRLIDRFQRRHQRLAVLPTNRLQLVADQVHGCKSASSSAGTPPRSLLARQRQGQRDVDRLVADDPVVPDLHPQSAQENNRVNRLQTPVAPRQHVLAHRIVTRLIRSGETSLKAALRQFNLYWHARHRAWAEIVFNGLYARQGLRRAFGRRGLIDVFDHAPEPDIAVVHGDIDEDRIKLVLVQ
jgi:hypothetical protein